jgi:hypothetical protein
MSSGSSDTHASADHHDDHAFDGEPIDELPADEPRTPGWLPALGAILFVSAAVLFLATRDSSAQPAAPAPEKAAVAAQAPVAPAPLPPQQRIAQPQAAPSSSADAALRRLSPEQIRALQKQLETMKAKQGAAPAAPPAH